MRGPAETREPTAGLARRVGGVQRGPSFEPRSGERPLTRDEAICYFSDLYAARKAAYTAIAKRSIDRLGLAELGYGDPEALVNEAILALTERAADPSGRTPLYRSGGEGLLARQIQYTAKQLSARHRRPTRNRAIEIPGGAGIEVHDQPLELIPSHDLDRLERVLAREAMREDGSAGLEVAMYVAQEELPRLVAHLRSALRAALVRGELRLTRAQYDALRVTHRRSGSAPPLPDRDRAAAKRARDVLWPWFVASLRQSLPEWTDLIPLDGGRDERLDAFLDAVGFFEDGFMEGIQLRGGSGAGSAG
jgi:hypothetical protein